MHSKQRLTVIESFLIAATVFVIAFVGYAVYQTQQISDHPFEEVQIIPGDDALDRVSDAPEVDSADDLDAAVEFLDDMDTEAGLEDDAALESEASDI